MLHALTRWQRVALAAVAALLILLAMVLTLPAWLVLPFRDTGRAFILDLADKYTEWIRAILGEPREPGDGKPS
ncbi:MAG: hypothetical protein DIU60_009730 [Actinomycetes bacterium]|jgi:hypothetical protein|nr:MAG: hypothetical protein DIU60_12480 [Actinomycetota bacterium]